MEGHRSGEDPPEVEESKIKVNKESEIRIVDNRWRIFNFILNEVVKQKILEKKLLIIQGFRKTKSMLGFDNGL